MHETGEPAPVARPAALDLSVVVTTFNDAPFIEQTLRAIAEQTYPDFDVVVVDDGSTDETPERVAEFCRQDERFRLHRQENRGASGARNAGVALTDGDWIALCDGDDYWVPEKLERQIAFIEAHRDRYDEPLVAVGANQYHVGGRGTRVRKFHPLGIRTAEEFRRQRSKHGIIYLPTSTLVFRRDAFERVGGYDPADVAANDVGFTNRLADHGILLNMPDYLAHYRVYGSSLTDERFAFQKINHSRIRENSRRRAANEPEVDYETHLEQLQRDPAAFAELQDDIRVRYLYRRGYVALMNDHYLQGVGFFARAALRGPRFIFRKLARHLGGRSGRTSASTPGGAPRNRSVGSHGGDG